MADPILGLNELAEGDPLGFLIQNERNLIESKLAIDVRVVSDAVTDPSGITPSRGDMYIIGAGGGTSSTPWDGQAANTVAIALSDDPAVASGWYFLTPFHGLRVWILAGTNTGHRVWNGTAWAAV